MSRPALLAVLRAWLGRPGADEAARAALAAGATLTPALSRKRERGPEQKTFALAAEARAHRLAAVALEVAERLGAPTDLADELRLAARADAARALLLEAAAAELAEAAAARSLRAALLKGPALDGIYYPRPGLRAYDDLDLLIAPQDAAGWAELLRAQGYAPLGRVDRSWRAPRGELVDLHFKSSDLVGVIDVPEELSPVRLDVAGMLARAGSVEGRAESRGAEPSALRLPFPALAREDELVLAAGHGLGVHVFERLVWLLDVAVLCGPGLDAARLVELARASSGAARLVFHALEIARQLGLAEAPAELLEVLRPPRIGRLERRLIGRLARGAALPGQAEYLLALALPAPGGYKRTLVRRALLPRRRAVQPAGGGLLGGALRHAREILRLGALALRG